MAQPDIKDIDESISPQKSGETDSTKKAKGPGSKIASGFLAATLLGGVPIVGTAVMSTGCEKPENDIEKPTVVSSKSSLDISGGEIVSIRGNSVWVGDTEVAKFKGQNLTITCQFQPKGASTSTWQNVSTINGSGTLKIQATNKAGNPPATVTCTINKKEVINFNIHREYSPDTAPNIYGGVVVKTDNSQLSFGDVAIYKWDQNQTCTPSFQIDGITIQSGDTVKNLKNGNHTGRLTLTNTKGNSDYVEFPITSEGVDLSGLTNHLEIGKEVNLLQLINCPHGMNIDKVEVEIDGERHELSQDELSHFTPNRMHYHFYVLAKGEFGNSNPQDIEVEVAGLEYHSMEINNIDPAEIMPIINQVEQGDKECYKHIEHLRLAEVVRVLDMMREYGTGKHSKEQYQELMMRLNPVMLNENPNYGNSNGFDNCEIIGGELLDNPSKHARYGREHLNRRIKHANFKIINTLRFGRDWYNLCKSNPSKINIGGCSRGAEVDRNGYDLWHEEEYKKYDKEKNGLVFYAGGDVGRDSGINDGVYTHKIYQEDYTLDEDAVYMEGSRAHNKDDTVLDRHLEISVGTNRKGDVDITGQIASNYSKYPYGFHPKVLFSGRSLPYINVDGIVCAAQPNMYAASYANYVNVVIACLCFQMFAEVEDVDQLLEMIRSTALTDYIRYNGDTQELQLMNPAGFFKEYCMLADIPSSISAGETVMLTKGRYKGLVFDIPGAEVYIEGKGWISYCKENESLIKSQNPMNLQWRLNGTLCTQYGYNGKDIEGKMIAVDDQRNGLSMNKDISFHVQKSTNLAQAQHTQRETININQTKPDIHLAEIARIQPNMIADIPNEISPRQKFLLGDHIKVDGPLKSYAEVYQESKGRVPYKDAEKSPDILNLQVRLNPSLADGRMKGFISSLNPKGEIIKKQKIDSLVIYPNIKIAQTPSRNITHTYQKTTPRNKPYQSSIRDTLGEKQKFDKGIDYAKNNNIPRKPQTPRTQKGNRTV